MSLWGLVLLGTRPRGAQIPPQPSAFTAAPRLFFMSQLGGSADFLTSTEKTHLSSHLLVQHLQGPERSAARGIKTRPTAEMTWMCFHGEAPKVSCCGPHSTTRLLFLLLGHMTSQHLVPPLFKAVRKSLLPCRRTRSISQHSSKVTSRGLSGSAHMAQEMLAVCSLAFMRSTAMLDERLSNSGLASKAG